MIGTDAFQETPIVEVTRQITKHNYLVMDVRDLPRIVKEVRQLSLLMTPSEFYAQMSSPVAISAWTICKAYFMQLQSY